MLAASLLVVSEAPLKLGILAVQLVAQIFRGYTAWDMSSPSFIRRGPNGNFLCVPTAFCSWGGHALDYKTPLLKSEDAVSKAATRLLHLLGDKDVKYVNSEVGIEQEFF